MQKRNLVPVLVGQLLVESGMLESETLSVALERARDEGIKVGQILLYSGLVKDRDLKAALLAQRMLRLSLISFKQAVEALQLVRQEKMSYQGALARARWLYCNQQIHQFAKLLMDSDLLNTSELGFYLGLSIQNGYALGRTLLVHGKITLEERKALIDAIILTRTGEITYEHAVAAMKAMQRTGHGIRELLAVEASPASVIADELVHSGVLTEFEVMDIIEESLQRDNIWKGSMTGSTIIANLKFAASLAVNRMVAEGSISLEQAKSLCRELLLSTASVLKNINNIGNANTAANLLPAQAIA